MDSCFACVGALSCIIRKRVYHGRLSYLPFDEPEDAAPPSPPATCVASTPDTTGDSSGVTCSPNTLLSGHTVETNQGMSIPDKGKEEKEKEKELEREQRNFQDRVGAGNVSEEASVGSAAGDEGRYSHTNVSGENMEAGKEGKEETQDAFKLRTSPAEQVRQETDSAFNEKLLDAETLKTPRTSSGPVPSLLPELTQPVPGSWKTIEGEFVAVNTLMISHISSNFIGDPKMTIGTGRIRLQYIRSMSRLGLLRVMSEAEEGHHLGRNGVSSIDVKAFRLEPLTEGGIMTVDGEVVKYGPLQTQIHRHMARVFCRRRTSLDSVSA